MTQQVPFHCLGRLGSIPKRGGIQIPLLWLGYGCVSCCGILLPIILKLGTLTFFGHSDIFWNSDIFWKVAIACTSVFLGSCCCMHFNWLVSVACTCGNGRDHKMWINICVQSHTCSMLMMFILRKICMGHKSILSLIRKEHCKLLHTWLHLCIFIS